MPIYISKILAIDAKEPLEFQERVKTDFPIVNDILESQPEILSGSSENINNLILKNIFQQNFKQNIFSTIDNDYRLLLLNKK
jgi:hypothetical protein